MAMLSLPDQGLLRQLLDYDAATGILYWKARLDGSAGSKRFNTKMAGKQAFIKIENGYYRGRLLGKDYRAHRIIWKWWYGTEPELIDHANHDRLDNRIENLRSVQALENSKNYKKPRTNKSGCAGVVWHERDQRWQASIRHGGRKLHLGLFTDFDEAVAVRQAAERRYGFHRNHGR